jgi:hypothetical protein
MDGIGSEFLDLADLFQPANVAERTKYTRHHRAKNVRIVELAMRQSERIYPDRRWSCTKDQAEVDSRAPGP